MRKETDKFYRKLKFDGVDYAPGDDEIPITFTHIFKKSYPRLPQVSLPNPRAGNLGEILGKRESSREFSEIPLSLEDLSNVLNSYKKLDRSTDLERRTYPSAGARFPIEMYVIGYNVGNLSNGAYHFNIESRRLETLWNQDLSDKKDEISGPNIFNPAFTLVLTSVIPRSEVKYGPKALSFSYLEAGHIGQNLLLSATENGIGACPLGGFVDDTLIKILDLVEDEIPVYTVSMGNLKR
jgi:SagB-type dehydrogenase family enzyme